MLYCLIDPTAQRDSSIREIAGALEMSHTAVWNAVKRNRKLGASGVSWGVRQSTSRQITHGQRQEVIGHWHDNTRQSADVSALSLVSLLSCIPRCLTLFIPMSHTVYMYSAVSLWC